MYEDEVPERQVTGQSPYKSAHERPAVGTEMELLSGKTVVTGSGIQGGSVSPARQSLQDRALGPRRLFFLTGNRVHGTGNLSYENMNVDTWRDQNPTAGSIKYVFVSYTANQFPTALLDQMAHWKGISDAEKQDRAKVAASNRIILERRGAVAASEAGAHAFWLDYACLGTIRNVTTGVDPEAWQICDIVSAAHSMVIISGPPYAFPSVRPSARYISSTERKAWLSHWSNRIWTLPELLLCPSHEDIKIYTSDQDNGEFVAKRSICQTLEDGHRLRELLDHYEGLIHLTPLEHVSLAAECLFRRPFNKRHAGDVAYSLTGLLRRRPRVDVNDSEFKAFARLSLANDSDRLLERLVCFQPISPHALWHKMDDAYGASLWDVQPCCQIAGIIDAPLSATPEGQPKIVTLDGAFCATIQWDAMEPIAFFKRPSSRRVFAKILLRGVPGYFIVALIMLIFSRGIKAVIIPGAVIMAICGLLTLLLPSLLLALYRGKFWSTQAHVVGMQGMPADGKLGKAEQHLFGLDCGRLKWSTHGSMLSRAVKRRNGELKELIPDAGVAGAQGQQLYTIIDTFAMTASAFYAKRPSTAVIICGQEGGMQRAILCSYDPVTRAFRKETVLRMKTLCLERMERMDRFRFML